MSLGIGFVAIGLLGLGCTTRAIENAAPAAPTSVDQLIGDASCDDRAQCHVIGVGAKACGGPSGYRAWSSKTTDPNALRDAVQSQSRADAEAVRRRGMASDCSVLPEPTATCRPRAADGRKVCQITPT